MNTIADRTLSARRLRPIEFDHDSPRPKRDKRTATPQDYFRPFRKLLAKAAQAGVPEILVVIYCRVSSGKQRYKDNIVHQFTAVREKLAELACMYGVKVTILDEFGDDGKPGWAFWKSGEYGRPGLLKAAKLARKHNAVLVALNTSRFVRNRHFYPDRILPTVADFEELLSYVGNVQLATLQHPNFHENKSADTSRGIKGKNAKVGRPPKISYSAPYTRLPKKFAKVVRLRNQGWSWGAISEAVKRPRSTVQTWYQHFQEGVRISQKRHAK